MCGISQTHPVLASFFFFFFFSFSFSGEFLTHPVLFSFPFLSGEFLLHIPCRFNFYLGSFSYTSQAAVIFMLGVTHPMLPSCFFCVCVVVFFTFLSGEFLLHIPCYLDFYFGSFSYTSRAAFIFIWGVCVKHPVLPWFFFGSFPYTSRVGFNFVRGRSLTHPMVATFLFEEFLLHIPCWL